MAGLHLTTKLTRAAGALVAFAVAHELTYALLEPDAGHRDETLAATGHGYLHALEHSLPLLVALAALGLVRMARQPAHVRRRTAARGTAALVVAFPLVELAERVLSGSEIAVPVLLLGAVLQLLVVVAVLGTRALAVEVLGVAARWTPVALLGSLGRHRPAPRRTAPVSVVRRCAAPRGPPLAA